MFDAMISFSLCSDCLHTRCHSCHYCIFMDLARGLGLIGMRGVGKNTALQNRKKREYSTATHCSALIADLAGWGDYTMPNGWSLFTTDCVISPARC